MGPKNKTLLHLLPHRARASLKPLWNTNLWMAAVVVGETPGYKTVLIKTEKEKATSETHWDDIDDSPMDFTNGPLPRIERETPLTSSSYHSRKAGLPSRPHPYEYRWTHVLAPGGGGLQPPKVALQSRAQSLHCAPGAKPKALHLIHRHSSLVGIL